MKKFEQELLKQLTQLLLDIMILNYDKHNLHKLNKKILLTKIYQIKIKIILLLIMIFLKILYQKLDE
ncbi:MAG: hypothetical protein B6229_01360 [Spirochaetaceae bacterium 4572_7]|nr:MAG: hypothetical protein B6229_01360 [Spirochaetaceae bacterium 4572_7]